MMNKVLVIFVITVLLNDTEVADAAAGVAQAPFLSATSSSTYANNANCYGPTMAIDGYYDYSGCRMFHSRASTYPWLAAVIGPVAKNVGSVTFRSRCDANGWGHTSFTLTVKAGTDAVTTALNAGTLALTQNTLCGSFTGTVARCSTVTITCSALISSATMLTAQLHTTGSQNVHLMFEEMTFTETLPAGPATAAISSSIYYQPWGFYPQYWGPLYAIDQKQSNTWYGFFHSKWETYPWLQITLPAATRSVATVTLRSRCNANAWACSVPNPINVEVRAGIIATAAGSTGRITANTLCGTKTGCDASACQTHVLTCNGGTAIATTAQTYVTVQMIDATNTHLQLDEVTVA